MLPFNLSELVWFRLRRGCKNGAVAKLSTEKTVHSSKSIVDDRAAQPLKRPARATQLLAPGERIRSPGDGKNSIGRALQGRHK